MGVRSDARIRDRVQGLLESWAAEFSGVRNEEILERLDYGTRRRVPLFDGLFVSNSSSLLCVLLDSCCQFEHALTPEISYGRVSSALAQAPLGHVLPLSKGLRIQIKCGGGGNKVDVAVLLAVVGSCMVVAEQVVA